MDSSQQFDPLTVDYAIEQCTDLAVLRNLARQYRAAMIGEHDKAQHFLEIEDCMKCLQAKHEGTGPDEACDQYKAWQKSYEAALGADRVLARASIVDAQPHVAIRPGHRFTTVTIGGATVAVLWRSELTRLWYVTDGIWPASEHTSRQAADAQVAEHVAHALESAPTRPDTEA